MVAVETRRADSFKLKEIEHAQFEVMVKVDGGWLIVSVTDNEGDFFKAQSELMARDADSVQYRVRRITMTEHQTYYEQLEKLGVSEND